MTALALGDLVSDHVLRGVTLRYGAPGRAWLSTLPVLVEEVLAEHRLTLAGPLSGGALSAVLAVTTQDGDDAVLKIHPGAATWVEERDTLTAWSRQAASLGVPAPAPVIVAETPSSYATVMTRLVPGTQLRTAQLPDPVAVRVEAEALAGLFTVISATPAPESGLEALEARVVSSARRTVASFDGHPVLAELLAGAGALFSAANGELALRPASVSWCHGDLIANNVLDAGGRWALIDPLPVAGEVASDVAFLAVSRRCGAGMRDLVEAYSGAVGVDGDRVAAFARVWAADRLRVAVTHGFFGPEQWRDLATVARSGPVT